MKLSVVSSDFSKALARIINVVPSKSTLPVLEFVLMELTGNELKLTASDLEISMSVTLQVNGIADGSIAIPAKKLNETLRALPALDITLTADTSGNRITIKTDQGEYKMSGDSASNFPASENVQGAVSIELDASLLRSLIGKTVFAVSTDDLRPAMMGVLFQWRSGEFRAVATDGHRLVLLKHFGALSSMEGMSDHDVIIPAKALNLVLRTLDSGVVTVVFGKSHVRFSMNEVQLLSRIIDERYPNYDSVIPLENDKELLVNRSAIVSAIHRCAIFANAITNQIRLSITNEQTRVSSEDIEQGGEAKEVIATSFSSDEELDIGFNSRYLLDALQHMDSDEIIIFFSSSTRAGVIRPKPADSELDVLMLVMPLRLNA
jgi:DNA polymerase III subunit beta